MTVKIVTDTLSDITADLAEELGVTVVPVYVRFGDEVYRDRVEMTTEEFYRRLVQDANFPTTTQPTPNDFLDVYTRLAKEADGILVVTLSSKLSGTYQSALQAKDMFEGECCIEVIDSQLVVMGLGLVIVEVARAVQAGASLDEAAELVRRAVMRSHSVMLMDTLKYLVKGGRIGKAKGLVGSLLSVQHILTLKDGEVSPMTRVRTRVAGIDYLYNYVTGFPNIGGLAVEYATTRDEAEKLVERIGSLFPKENIYISTVSPVIGAYVGPNVVSVSILEAGEGL
jgi:DegV family protein with EDD domain